MAASLPPPVGDQLTPIQALIAGVQTPARPAETAAEQALVIVAALRSRCEHYIFALWFLSIFFLFLAESQPSQIGCLPYFDT